MAKKKQMTIEGTQDDLVPEIEEAAAKVRELTEQRKEVHKDERAARSTLIERMQEHGRDQYTYEDEDGKKVRAVLKHGEVKVSVRRVRDEADVDEASEAQAAE